MVDRCGIPMTSHILELAPQLKKTCARCPVLFLPEAPLTGCVTNNVLGKEVDFSAQSVLEVQPREDLDFVRQSGAPYKPAVDITNIA
jgi:hypothetical protein